MNKKIIVAVLCFAVSMIFTLQLKTIRTAKNDVKPMEVKTKDTLTLLENERALTKELNASINENLEKKDMYLKYSKEGDKHEELKKEWERVSRISGLTDVVGEGIIITVNDAAHDVYTHELMNNYKEAKDMVVHDMDLVCILNELKIYGCSAISINDERVVSTSEQMCAGTTVRVNKRRYVPPYEIKAIGDANKLFEGVNNSEYVNDLRLNNIRVSIKKESNLTVYKYKDDIKKLITGLEVSKNG